MSERIIYVANEAMLERVQAANPLATVMVRGAKKRSVETAEQRAARQAATARQKAAYEAKLMAEMPAARVYPKSVLFRLSEKRVPGGRASVTAALMAAAIGAGYGAGRLRKADEETARRVALGAGLTYGTYAGAGYGLNIPTRAASRRDKVSNELMREHQRKFGMQPGGLVAQKLPSKQIEQMYRTTPAGVKFAGTKRLLARTHGAKGRGRLALPVLAAGAVGGAAYDAGVRKSTVEYMNIPDWAKQTEAPRTYRRNLDPLMMYSSGLIMVDADAAARGRKIRGSKRRRKVGMNEAKYTGGRAMLYSPLGHGSGA